MANAPAVAKSDFLADLRTAEAASRRAVAKARARATDSVWHKTWTPFVESLGIDDPFLSDVDDKVPLLRVFACRVRDVPVAAATPSALRTYVTKCSKWPKRSWHWGPRTPA